MTELALSMKKESISIATMNLVESSILGGEVTIINKRITNERSKGSQRHSHAFSFAIVQRVCPLTHCKDLVNVVDTITVQVLTFSRTF